MRCRAFFGTDLLSHPVGPLVPSGSYEGPSGFVSVGTPVARYPASNLNDGVAGLYTKITGPTAGFAIDARQVITPEFVVALNGTLTADTTVRLQASASSSFSSLLLDAVVTNVARDFFIDRRSAPIAAQYWRLLSYGATERVLGELLLVTSSSEWPDTQWEFTDRTIRMQRALAMTPVGVRHRRRYLATKTVRQFHVVGPDTRVAPLEAWAKYAQRERWPLLFIEDIDGDDVGLFEYNGTLTYKRLLDNRKAISIVMPRQGGGVISG